MVAAHLAVQGADQEAVQRAAGRSAGNASSAHRPRPRAVVTEARCRQRSRSAPSSCVRRPGRGRERADDQLAAGREVGESVTAQVAEPALDTMADDGVADGPADHEPDARRVAAGRRRRTGARPGCRPRCGGPRATTRRRSPPRVRRCGAGSTDARSRSRVEPRGLRPPGSCGPCGDARTGSQRPARVRMRSRNPCTLWRRRLFGWYVRLLTSSLRWWSGTDHAGGRPDRPMASDSAGRNPVTGIGVSAGTAHPRTGPRERPRTGRDGAWTCGTRRHRVTEERYARRLRRVKSRPGAGRVRAGPVDIGRARTPPIAGSPQAVPASLWIASCSAGSRRGYVRPSSSFPAFGSDPPPTAATESRGVPEMASDLR